MRVEKDWLIPIVVGVLFIYSSVAHIYTTQKVHEESMREGILYEAQFLAEVFLEELEEDIVKPGHVQDFFDLHLDFNHLKVLGLVCLNNKSDRYLTYVAHSDRFRRNSHAERVTELLPQILESGFVEDEILLNDETEKVMVYHLVGPISGPKGVLVLGRICRDLEPLEFFPPMANVLLFLLLMIHFYQSRRTLGKELRRRRAIAEELKINQELLEEGLYCEKKQGKRLERRLKQAGKMEAIGTLSGGIAHDFNNILGAILGYAELVSRKLPKGTKEWEDTQKIYKAGLRAKDLVARILTFSRYTDQEELKPIHMRPAVENALEFLRASIPSSVVIRESFDEDKDLVVGDETQLHQVLLNLCTNAAQAMDDEGILTITTSNVFLGENDLRDLGPHLVPGVYVEITVGDNGHGMTQETMDKIFDPFFTTKETGSGTGLGLSMVRGIVLGHGGFLTVSSEIDVGSTFAIYLPLTRSLSEQFQEEEKIKHMPKVPGRKRILFVDDEVFLREIGRRLLGDMGCEVITKKDGKLAWEEFEKSPDMFDLLITDQTMPKMTGLELVKKVKEIRPDLPVVLATGFNSKVNEAEFKMMKLSGFYHKPLGRGDYEKILREVFSPGEE